ncbi:MAG: hypothetical protein ACJAU5_000527 [Maricaulis maris]|jgi:hypothetical protein
MLMDAKKDPDAQARGPHGGIWGFSVTVDDV